MSAQVIYIFTGYTPGEEALAELDKRQEFLYYCHVEFDQQYRYLMPSELKKKKESVYQRARQGIGIVKMKDD